MTLRARRDELTMNERGRWLVHSTTATVAFDLRTGTVETVDDTGNWRRILGNQALRLKAIDIVRVGEPARWLMYRPGAGFAGSLYTFVSEPVTDIVSAREPSEAAASAGVSYLGPAYTAEAMRERLGVEPNVLSHMVEELQLLRATLENGRELFPAVQLTEDGKLLPGLNAVLCELVDGADDPWAWWQFLTGAAAHLDRQPLWELLQEGDSEAVIRAASRAAWVWRQ